MARRRSTDSIAAAQVAARAAAPDAKVAAPADAPPAQSEAYGEYVALMGKAGQTPMSPEVFAAQTTIGTVRGVSEAPPAPGPVPVPAGGYYVLPGETPSQYAGRVTGTVGTVTAADVQAQAKALGQTITPELAAVVAQGLTNQGLTPATYRAGVQAAQTYLKTAGKAATPAGETAAVLKAQAAVPVPKPPRVLQIGTVTPDIVSKVHLPVGSHFAKLEGNVIVPVTQSEWKAGLKASTKDIQARAAPGIASAALSQQAYALAAKWQPMIKDNKFTGTAEQYEQYKAESDKLGQAVKEYMPTNK